MSRSAHKIVQTVCSAIAARRDELVHALEAHVAIPTGHNHTPGLDRYRNEITGRLAALGASVEYEAGDLGPDWLRGPREAAAIPPTAICRREVAGLPRILLVSHLDTVFDPAGEFTEMVISPQGDVAVGPGVVDMKGGVLVAVTALEALAAAGFELSWTYVLNSDEETGSFASARTLRAQAARADVGLVTEPALPGGALAIARRGAGQFMIEARGRSAHAGRAFEDGVSAVYGLAEVLVSLSHLSDADRGLVVNVGPISGGGATNVVPDHAAAWGNVRFPDPESADELGRAMDALATPADHLPAIEVRRTFNRPAKPTTPGVERLANMARQAAADLGQDLPFQSTGGVCDGNILQEAGLPVIDTLGVRGGGLHTTEEWIELDSLVERSQLMACLLIRLTEEWNT
ncbi:MAG: M20/M25/M40 family metallo-hydrolase [Phycisphaerales bacterium]|nr:M20/M25/M40 family metallo-hydrolase [Phycisphaerales bacterium]